MGLAPSGCRCFARISRSCEVPFPIFSQPLRKRSAARCLLDVTTHSRFRDIGLNGEVVGTASDLRNRK